MLPNVISTDQCGFVDGRYMVTRTLYDAVYDAIRSKNNKKGIIMSIDFEKAFDSVAHSFMLRATELAGFPKKTLDWIRILLKDFRSHVNHVGNLLKLIELGRRARQGDPIASILFVIAIEILLIALRKTKGSGPMNLMQLGRASQLIAKQRLIRACALRALGFLLADGTPTVGGGKTF